MHIQYKLRTLHLQETCLYDRLRIYRRTAQGSAHTEKHDCDPAEVLCMEMRSARPVLNSWLSDLAADCNEDEIKIITDTVTALKASLHRNRSEDK